MRRPDCIASLAWLALMSIASLLSPGAWAADVILAPPREAATWALGELLTSQRRWGGTRCRKFLSQFQITETKAIGALTERQRRVLAAQLDHCASRELQLASRELQLV